MSFMLERMHKQGPTYAERAWRDAGLPGTIADVLRGALTALKAYGWHKGALRGPDGSVCTLGAVDVAVTSMPFFREARERYMLRSVRDPLLMPYQFEEPSCDPRAAEAAVRIVRAHIVETMVRHRVIDGPLPHMGRVAGLVNDDDVTGRIIAEYNDKRVGSAREIVALLRAAIDEVHGDPQGRFHESRMRYMRDVQAARTLEQRRIEREQAEELVERAAREAREQEMKQVAITPEAEAIVQQFADAMLAEIRVDVLDAAADAVREETRELVPC